MTNATTRTWGDADVQESLTVLGIRTCANKAKNMAFAYRTDEAIEALAWACAHRSNLTTDEPGDIEPLMTQAANAIRVFCGVDPFNI